jgi:hypothetical protein
MSEAKTTTDHAAIRRWVEERGGRPVSVEGTERRSDPAGVLRIDFPGHGAEEGLTELSWEDFFEKFEKEKLAFLHQDETKGGAESRFFKFVQRDAEP